MKKYLIPLLVIFVIVSCKKEEKIDLKSAYFWAPLLQIENGDRVATLVLIDPRPATEYYPFPPSDPDYFEILISNEPKNFSFYKRIDLSTRTVKITNLSNIEPYYFVVTSHKSNYIPIYSDTVSRIPAKAIKIMQRL